MTKAERSNARPSVMPTHLDYGSTTPLTVTDPRPRGKPIEHDVVQRAVAALADPRVETFTRAQVAFLIRLALDYREADEWQAGYDYADAELVDGIRVALGGPEAKDFTQARQWHQRGLDQKRRRAASDAAARLPRPGDYRGGPVEWEVPDDARVAA